MQKLIFIMVLLCNISFQTNAQNPAYPIPEPLSNLIQAEYFFDNFVAIGSGTSIPLTASTDLANLNLSINTTNLQGGYHQLYIRTQDATGKWSITNTKRFFVDADPAYSVAPTLPNIIKAEYFIDNFVAIGSGTSIPLTASTDLANLNLSINTTALQGGYHQLYIRTQDATGKWSITNTKRFFVDQDPAYSTVAALPNIVHAEYFIDNFVAIGNATPIMMNPSIDINSLSISIATEKLCDGFHKLYIRTKDANGKWSMTNIKQFEVIGDSSIVEYQYFFDNDPGIGIVGNGDIQTLSPTATFSQNLNINIPTTLNHGWHTVFTRVRNDHCVWSIAERSTFLISPISTSNAPIVKYQYYFDTDPGLDVAGNGIVQNVSADTIFSMNININLPNTLNEGFHTLFTRIQNNVGVWSIADRYSFYILPVTPNITISKYQYYFDNDPGLGIAGNGAVLNTPVDSVFSSNLNIAIPNSLAEGFHTLFTRVQNNMSVWSIAERRSFYVQEDGTTQLITGLEYFFNADPGVGNATSYSVTLNDTINITANIPTIGLPDGVHILYVRAKDEYNRWSLIEKDTFTIFNGMLANNLKFNGSYDHVSLPNGGGLSNATVGTIEMWVKWNFNIQPSGYQSYGAVMGRQQNGSFSNHILALDGPDPNTAKIIWKPYLPYINTLVSSISPGNTWNHIAIVFDGSSHKMYINGILDASTIVGGAFANNPTTPLTIGAWTGDGNCYSNSNIDEVRIWNVARTQTDIQSSMSCELVSPQSGMLGNYHFNQGFSEAANLSENILVNETGNGNGSLINFTLYGTNSNWTHSSPIISGVHCTNNASLQLKLFIEGYYTGSNSMNAALYNQGVSSNSLETDSIEVELRNPITLTAAAATKIVLHNNGEAFWNSIPVSGDYYIVIKSRNVVQTWSAAPITISAFSMYDFTNAISKAFGDNQSEVENGVWAIYSGDLSQDENIDLLDLSELESDINAFQFGYFSTDINGDGNVDLLDAPTVEANINNFIFSVHP